MAARTLQAFLDSQHVKYINIRHSAAFTAPEVAASAHVSGRDFAKTLIVVIEGELAMVALPANRKLVLSELCELFETPHVRLATEAEYKNAFPDCEVGAMPPFGHLYGMATYVTSNLADEPEIAFNAGTHTEVLKMAYEEYERLVKPIVLDWVTT